MRAELAPTTCCEIFESGEAFTNGGRRRSAGRGYGATAVYRCSSQKRRPWWRAVVIVAALVLAAIVLSVLMAFLGLWQMVF